MNVIYLGIDLLYPVLEALLREGCNVTKIFTCPTDNVTEFNTAVIAAAKARNIPWTTNRLTEQDLWEWKNACDLLVCAGYYYRIPTTEAFPMVNFHPAPLPMARGGWPMPQIILRNLPEGGITVHKIASELDQGDILMEETFPIRPEETLESYMMQVSDRVPDLVHRLVMDLPGILSQARPQEKGDYWPMPTEQDWTITPDMEVEQADRILRAFYGYECIYKDREECTELIKGRAIRGNSRGQRFPVHGGYLKAERIRKL